MVSPNVKIVIENSLKNNKLSHCYLLKATPGLNIDDSVVFMINKITNSNLETLDSTNLPANVILFDNNQSQGNALAKDKIVEVFEQSNLSSFSEDQVKLIIFKNIENASKAALNSLLKTIEEPTKNNCFILTTNNVNAVLETIKSRSIIININRPSFKELQEAFELDKYSANEAWFYSHIFPDIDKAEEYLDKNSYTYLQGLLEAFGASLKNPYMLYSYMTKFSKKENKTNFIFLSILLRFIYSWAWINDPYLNKNFGKLLKKMQESKIDFSACYIVLDDFLKIIDTNANYFLQAEKMLIKLMECYA